MIQRIRDALGRSRAYKRAFSGRDGEIALRDLARFCGANQNPFRQGKPDETAFRLGRLEVWQRIQSALNLSEADIAAMRRDEHDGGSRTSG
jgi:hypothetical protein